MLLSTSSSDDKLNIEEVSPASSTLTHSLFRKKAHIPALFFRLSEINPSFFPLILLRQVFLCKTVEFFENRDRMND